MQNLRWRCSVFVSRWRNRFRYLARAPLVYRNWWALPLPKLGVGVVLKLRNGLQYLVRSGTTDLAVVNEIALANPYGVVGYERLPENAVIVDIGANIGDFTVLMAHLRPHGRIFAIEPVSEHVRMIDIQILLNQFRNVTNLHLALGGHDGEIDIHVDGVASSSAWGDGAIERVRLTTLAHVMDEHQIDTIDLLKLDCEGAEWEILPASLDVLRRVRNLVMEFHCENGWTPERLAVLLREQGFVVEHTSSQSWNGLLWAHRSHD